MVQQRIQFFNIIIYNTIELFILHKIDFGFFMRFVLNCYYISFDISNIYMNFVYNCCSR